MNTATTQHSNIEAHMLIEASTDTLIKQRDELIEHLNDVQRKIELKSSVIDELKTSIAPEHMSGQEFSASARRQIIFEAVDQAANRKVGETMSIDLGFAMTEDEEFLLLQTWFNDYEMFFNRYTLSGSIIECTAYIEPPVV